MNYDLTDERDLLKLKLAVKSVYISITNKSDYEDCYQQILLKMLEGQHEKASVRQAVIDYLRSNVYNPRTDPTGEVKKFVEAKSFEQGNFDDEIPAAHKCELDFSRYVARLSNPQDRAAIVLRHKWGFSLEEIAEVLNLSPSYISLILRDAHLKLHIQFNGI